MPMPRTRLAAALAAALLAPAAAAAQQCPGGREPVPTLGIGVFHCVGGGCRINVRTPQGPAHDFSSEPRVWHLDPRGPAAGRLREGDVITSVDGALVTTPEGGRRLASLREGRAVVLGIRRDGEDLRVRLVPELGCRAPGLIVSSSPGKPHPPGGGPDGDPAERWLDERRPPWRVGVYLECECAWRRTGDGWEFRSSTPVRVKGVEPGTPADRAGIRPGDVIVSFHRQALEESGGTVRFGLLRPRQAVRLVYLRDGRRHTVTMTPEILRPDGG